MGPRLSQRSWAAGAGSPFWRRTRHPCDQHGAASWCTSSCFISARATATGPLSFDCASIALARHSAASSSPTAGTPTAAAARWCKTGRATDWRWTCGESSGAWRLVKPVERATTTQCSMCARQELLSAASRKGGVSENKPPTTRGEHAREELWCAEEYHSPIPVVFFFVHIPSVFSPNLRRTPLNHGRGTTRR